MSVNKNTKFKAIYLFRVLANFFADLEPVPTTKAMPTVIVLQRQAAALRVSTLSTKLDWILIFPLKC